MRIQWLAANDLKGRSEYLSIIFAHMLQLIESRWAAKKFVYCYLFAPVLLDFFPLLHIASQTLLGFLGKGNLFNLSGIIILKVLADFAFLALPVPVSLLRLALVRRKGLL